MNASRRLVRCADAICVAIVLTAALVGLAIMPAAAATAVTPMIAANPYATFGVRSDGSVLATGALNAGQRIATVWSDISTLTVGAYHVAGLRADGTVVMAGNWAEPEVSGANGWTGIKQVACGAFHTVGLETSGTVRAAGNTDLNEVSGVSGWTGIKYIGCGQFHTIGVRTDGSVVATAWFNPAFPDPYGICNVSGWSGIKAVAGGQYFTAGLREDGTCVATGLNDFEDSPDLITHINDATAWNNIKKISAGYMDLAGLKNDGTVITSWDNSLIPGWTDIVDIAAGDYSVIGLRPDGTLVTYALPPNRDDLWHALNVSGWRLYPTKPTLSKPAAPASVKKSKYFTITGTLRPVHAKGLKIVTVYFERRGAKVHGKYTWGSRKTYVVTNGSAAHSATHWSLKLKLTSKGYWRAWSSTRADDAHLASKSSFEYLWVK